VGLADVTEALLGALAREGAAGAEWGDRVYLHTASSVVELAGPRAGDPVAVTWPCLLLAGPDVAENRARRAPHQRERHRFDAATGAIEVRPFPRYYAVRFEATLQTRVASTGPGTTATRQLLDAIARFEVWLARTPKLAGCDLLSVATMSAGRARRPTPADLREATGRIEIRDVPEYAAGLTLVPAATDVVVAPVPDRRG
jgi:hypothetical protein